MNNNNQPLGWVEQKLKTLREELELSGSWPETANRLWLDIDQDNESQNEQGDEIMFSIVVSDAIDGIDIAERYPDFYRQMLRNPEIFQAFLDAIEVMEADKAGLLTSLPETKVVVPEKRPKDTITVLEWIASGSWIARWQQGFEQLNSIFSSFSPIPDPGFRSGWSMLEESPISLIRSEVAVEDINLGVKLTATWGDDPDALDLQLTVSLVDDEAVEDSAALPLTSLKADIYWGAYHQASAVDKYGLAVFPPLSIAAITDETEQEIITDLQLVLRPAD